MKQRKKTGQERLIFAGMAVCIGVLVYCAFQFSRYIEESRNHQKAREEAVSRYVSAQPAGSEDAADFSVDFAGLRCVSKHVVGWIRIAGLEVIDYPIVQGSDDTYYLRHNWDDRVSRYGAIFMEWENQPDFNDLHTILSGHSMNDGSMFGSLKQYANADFYSQFGGEITISLPAETRRYRIFSVEYAQPDAFNVYTIGFGHDETYAEFIQGFHERALYKTDVEATRADSVLTLSTCSDNGERRFVVHARLESVQPHNS